MSLSNGAVIVIAIIVAGFVVVTGAVIFKFNGGRGGQEVDEETSFNQRSNTQEHYSKSSKVAVANVWKQPANILAVREVRERNKAWNHFEARYGERYGGHTGAPSTISGTNVYSSHMTMNTER